MTYILVFVLLVTTPDDAKQANILINCINKFGGKYKNSPVYVMLTDPKNGLTLNQNNVRPIPFDLDNSISKYPYAIKAQAMAKAEEIAAKESKTMAWLDVNSLILNEPSEFDLPAGKKIALRPVYLNNTIGISPERDVDKYWEPIYNFSNINIADLPIVETVVDNVKIRAYYNCAVFSIDPTLKILQTSFYLFSALVKDKEYQASACSDKLHKIFLHQAAFTGIVLSKIRQEEIHWFSNNHHYPLMLHNNLKPEKKEVKMNNLICGIYDYLWENPQQIFKIIQIDEPLRSWLQNEFNIQDSINENKN